MNQRGITLIEMVISILILGIILGIIYNTLSVGLKAWEFGDKETEIVQNARIALERMTHEIRHADMIYKALDSALEFRHFAQAQKIYYYLDLEANNLYRQVNGGTTDPLANYVSDFQLKYRGIKGTDNNAELVPPDDTNTPEERANIRVITVTLTVEKEDQKTELRSCLSPRNRILREP